MSLKNTGTSYGTISKCFHWLTALLVLCLICVGLYMVNAKKDASIFAFFTLHKTVGIFVLCLTVSRIIWHIYTRQPAFVGGMKPWEKLAAKAAHFFLYFALLTMPLSGWIFSSAAGRPVKLFGLDALTLPDLVGKNHAVKEALETYHVTMAWILIGVIAVHIAAALKHHLINKDSTLRRMLPFNKNE